MIIERLKFYADTPREKNKFFCWDNVSLLTFEDKLIEFMFEKDFTIRAAWHETINKDTGEIKNLRVSKQALQEIFDKEISKRMQESRK